MLIIVSVTLVYFVSVIILKKFMEKLENERIKELKPRRKLDKEFADLSASQCIKKFP